MTCTYTDKTYTIRDAQGRYVARGNHTCGNNVRAIGWWVCQMLEIKNIEPDRQLHDQILEMVRTK